MSGLAARHRTRDTASDPDDADRAHQEEAVAPADRKDRALLQQVAAADAQRNAHEEEAHRGCARAFRSARAGCWSRSVPASPRPRRQKGRIASRLQKPVARPQAAVNELHVPAPAVSTRTRPIRSAKGRPAPKALASIDDAEAKPRDQRELATAEREVGHDLGAKLATDGDMIDDMHSEEQCSEGARPALGTRSRQIRLFPPFSVRSGGEVKRDAALVTFAVRRRAGRRNVSSAD